jgi:hypothetical protein
VDPAGLGAFHWFAFTRDSTPTAPSGQARPPSSLPPGPAPYPGSQPSGESPLPLFLRDP